ncbi:DNA polymerase IV [Mariprofundus sp. EBB-1]|uniref:DNA polymerase IV n=1 Tax=Mariprofundus sp. EBB-1 TaxID=2650971 RepID=UPI000EF2008C|nr:DNA polymerase IV [Mariprofundus sp. EBB-1]RLL54390.1 DNA polymerase IV [Mariprofundus sp. EBB-1]
MAIQRKIIHVDMDAFFASVEQRDNPDYRGKPLIVGGQPNSRGVVAACSYEAREFGIHSAMSCAQAFKRCPQALFVPPRFEAYQQVSKQIREIFWRYAIQVEPLSLDEAYLDVTYTESCGGSATKMAQQIRKEILAETGLIASAGVSYNKFLAKIASDMDKPDGLYVVRPEAGEAFVASLPIKKFYGVGPATEKKLHKLGIYTGKDLQTWSREDLQQVLGSSAEYFYLAARGIDHRPVKSSRVRKSLGKETTFAKDILDREELLEHAKKLAEKVSLRLQAQKLMPKTITLKVKYGDFKQITRAFSQPQPFTNLKDIEAQLPKLLDQTEAGQCPVRLIGLTASNFDNGEDDHSPQQLILEL